FERQGSAVGFRDLPAQNQADSRAARLGGEEWDEQIRSVREAVSFILDPDFEICAVLQPSYLHASAGLKRSVCGISQEIDKQLLQLIDVGLNDQIGAGKKRHSHTRLQCRNAAYQRNDVQRLECGLRQAGKLCVSIHKTAEGFGSRVDDCKSALRVF